MPEEYNNVVSYMTCAWRVQQCCVLDDLCPVVRVGVGSSCVVCVTESVVDEGEAVRGGE